MDYLELVHPDDRERATEQAVELRSGETVVRFKNRYRCKDGSYRWLAWSATPSPAQRLFYGSARDVTDSVRVEQRLQESNERLKDQAVACESLLRDSAAKNDALVARERFKDEVAAMIVHDLRNLRDVTRFEDGLVSVGALELDPTALIRPLVEQRRVLARLREISIVMGSAAPLMITGDPDLFTRSVENILDNAFRYTPRGGRIEIELRESGASVDLRIGNSGVAVPVEIRDTLFNKHGQAGADLGPRNLGLGLYFCRLAIEAQGGAIWVEESQPLPTIFAIRLPRARAHAG